MKQPWRARRPLLDQLAGLSWEILDLDNKQHPGDTFRGNFTEVMILTVLRAQLKIIKAGWMTSRWERLDKQFTANRITGRKEASNHENRLTRIIE
jgi:type I restriction enzyme R subunit